MSEPPASRSILPVVLGLALMLLGLGLNLLGVSAANETGALSLKGVPLIGSALSPSVPSRLDGNIPINAGASDLRDINAHNSPSVSLNPKDPTSLAVSNRIDTPLFSAALNYSLDGGAHWAPTAIPVPPGEEQKVYAPDVAFGAGGRLYLSYVTLAGIGNVPHAVWVSTSDDKGRTLASPIRVAGEKSFQVRLIADRTNPDKIFMSWLQVDDVGTLKFTNPGNPIVFARSDNAGATWQGPIRVSPPSRQRVVAPSMAEGPNGELYMSYLDLKDDKLDYHGGHEGHGGEPYPGKWELVVARSTDSGATWSETAVDELTPTERFLVFLPPFPSIAAGAGGNVYVSFHDGRNGDPDVFVWSSADGAKTFGKGVRVNDTPLKDGTSQYLPKIAVAPTGRLDVLYYDRRGDPKNVMNNTSLQSSSDHGKTFSKHVKLNDRPFDSRIGFGSERDLPDLGSRLALVSTTSRAMAIWADTRSGTDVSGKQDLAQAVVAFRPPPSVITFLKHGGVGLAALGLVIGLAGLFRQGSKSRKKAPAQTEGAEATA